MRQRLFSKSGHCTDAWRPPRRPARRGAGLSLSEVLIAMAILATGIVGLGGMQVTAMKLNSRAHNTTQLATVAQEQMEKLLTLPATHAQLSDTNGLLGQATTHCSWYPPEGIRACAEHGFQSAHPNKQYCRPSTNRACANSTFPVPTIGYKVVWTVDQDTFGNPAPNAVGLMHIAITVSQKVEGKYTNPGDANDKDKTYKLSFARFNR